MSEPAPQHPRLWLAAIPVVVFMGLAAIFWRGLSGNPSEVPSALIGRPVPEFALPAVEGLGVPGFDTAALRQGKVTLVNIWASWCGPCRLEHPLLMELSKRTDLQLFGLNYKDEPENARRFLAPWASPMRRRVPTRRAALPSTGVSMACPKPLSSMDRASSASNGSAR